MKANVKQWIIGAIGAIVFFVLLGIAGAADAQDAYRVEAQNNGAYYTIGAQHPEWDDEEIITYYKEHREQYAD